MFKEILSLKGMPQSDIHHPEGDVYVHTRKCWNLLRKESRAVRLAALLHDIGKLITYKLKDGRHTYHGHDQELDFVLRILGNAKFKKHLSVDEIATIIFIFENHMRYKRINEMKKSKRERLLNHRFVKSLIAVCHADNSCREIYKNNKCEFPNTQNPKRKVFLNGIELDCVPTEFNYDSKNS